MEGIQEKVAKTMADEDVQELMRFDPSMEVSVNGKPVGPEHPPGASQTQQRERIANRLRVMRAELDTPEKLMEEVVLIKEGANELFSKGHAAAAQQAYCTAIWLLKEGRPPVPLCLGLAPV